MNGYDEKHLTGLRENNRVSSHSTVVCYNPNKESRITGVLFFSGGTIKIIFSRVP